MTAAKAMIGMSGGVDSSVAAWLTAQAGYDCIGATMRLHIGDGSDAEDAKNVADRMGIPFHVFDFSDDFRRLVKDSFVRAYEQGLTPNPCITCNRYLKFDAFLRKAQELGCEKIVTGHYAQIRQEENGRYLLSKAADTQKDQTYFLYSLTQEQLSHTLFPLGGLTKQAARQIAEEQGFINARKRDSQDICFVPDGDYLTFMKQYTGETYPDGDFLDQAGHVVGRHKGAVGYTIGQRKGLGLAMGAPVYVCGKDMQANTVTVGPNEALFHNALVATDWNWIAIESLNAPLRVKAKARSRMVEQDATVYPTENGLARVVFDEPQRAITPGQAVVLYDGDIVVGGGTILKTD
ncbi:MAG: tRNA 2-thiouridine(34) synthase MnmA [Oscillospiraceae bacterium]|nr:tRNA 2-thiouridine(34) synthase MnmA [Oscillospiraceae bacterium]